MASRRFGRSLLARQMDAVIGSRRSSCSALLSPVDSSTGKKTASLPVSKPVLCAGFAFLVLDPSIASAVSLGELSVDSNLGEPLSASVPVTIRGGESLARDCVTIFEQSGNDLHNLRKPGLKVPTTERPGTYSIRITTRQPLFEPMYEFAIRVQCLGAPLLMKHYVLMLDLPGLPAPLPRQTMQETIETIGPAASESTVRAQQPKLASTPAARPESARVSAPPARSDSGLTTAPAAARSQVPAEQINTGADYRVLPGDTLSSIAERVEGRPVGSTWDVADWIHAANPHAFVGGNPDLIKRGSMIQIPAPGYWETDTTAATYRESAITPESDNAAAPLSASIGTIKPGGYYRVSAGDCLSSIAERVEGRPVGSVWDVADWIHAANPDAFVGGNPDLIKLGSMIQIPAPGYWETGGAQAADLESAAAAAAVPAAADRAKTPDNETSEVIAPTPSQTVAAEEIDTGFADDLRSDADESPSDLAATPESETTPEAVLVEDFALSVDPGPDDRESVFAEPANNPALAAPNSAADDAAAFADTAAEIAAFRQQLAEARELVAAAQQTARNNQAIAATQSASNLSAEEDTRSFSPLLAISLGLLVGLALSSLLLRNRLVELFERLLGRSTAPSKGAMASLYDEPERSDSLPLDEPPPAYESAPSDIAEFDEIPPVSAQPPAPSLELEIPDSIELPSASPEPPVPKQIPVDELPAEIPSSDIPSSDIPSDTGITDPDPTGTISELFGLDDPDSLPDAMPEKTGEMELTHELTLKGLAGPDAEQPSEPGATPQAASDLELTKEITADALPVPDAEPEIGDGMEITHELTAKGLAASDATTETASDMEIPPHERTVQELAELVDPDDDDILSATLSEALGLLEQDYEDEFSASQIIDKPKLDPSFLDEDAPTIEELTGEKEDS